MAYIDYFQESNSSMSLADKIAIIKNNNKKSFVLLQELKTLRERKSIPPKQDNTALNLPKDTKTNSPSEEHVDEELTKIYNAISLLPITNLSEEEIINSIKDILKNYQVSDITISKIKLMLYKEYILYSQMATTATSEEEFAELKADINTIMTKIELLDELEDEQELSEDTQVESPHDPENNNLFFLTSDNGKIIALESLRRNIPREYYPAFKELILDLKIGDLKKAKRLVSRVYYQLSDHVNGPCIRLTFDKLSNGNYIIIDAFIKKFEKQNALYRRMLDNRDSQYLSKRNFYLTQVQDEEFKTKHEGYLAEILNLLDSQVLEEGNPDEKRTI